MQIILFATSALTIGHEQAKTKNYCDPLNARTNSSAQGYILSFL